jgi:DNA (cytosine-5)-methyltransferase 1
VRIGSLFSGAGGLDMAVEAVFGAETAWHCEIDPAASKVLAAHWPGVPNLGDITAVDWPAFLTGCYRDGIDLSVDILCGGFPCQDVSAAGRRAGIKDGTRSGLWAIFADAIAALRPQYVVIENVRGLLSARAHRVMERDDPIMGDDPDGFVLRAAGAVLGDLADLGYDAQWATVAASSVGAPHRRERVFILATDANRSGGRFERQFMQFMQRAVKGAAADDTEASREDAPNSPRDGRHEGWPESARLVGGSDAAVCGAGPVDLLPTPSVADGDGGHLTRSGERSGELLLPGVARAYGNGELLPTPNASDGSGGGQHPDRRQGHSRQLIDYVLAQEQWGKYAAAINRWESLTRPAPSPTEPNTKGNPRLNPRFSEWMQGWPDRWVDVGISRNDQLRCIGNGVVPQQCVAALRFLLSVCEVAA